MIGHKYAHLKSGAFSLDMSINVPFLEKMCKDALEVNPLYTNGFFLLIDTINLGWSMGVRLQLKKMYSKVCLKGFLNTKG